MTKEGAFAMVAMIGTTVDVPIEEPVHFAVQHTGSGETPLPADLPPATLLTPPSGRLFVDIEPREELVKASADFVHAVARALPHDPEDERLVDARVAEILGDEKPTPLTRKLPD